MEEHGSFKQPSERGIGLWRYMDLSKFVRMLQTRSIFFARADRLGDPFEGSNTRAGAAWTAHLATPAGASELQCFFPHYTADQAKLVFSDLSRFRQEQVSQTYISCWHASFVESAAMWSLYAGRGNAIAVKTTYDRLAGALKGRVFMGEVQYVDWDGYAFNQGNLLEPFVHKQASYAHEREIRAVIGRDYWDHDQPALVFDEYGVEYNLDMQSLIGEVYVSPAAPSWFKDVVTGLCSTYGLPAAVQTSKLSLQPAY